MKVILLKDVAKIGRRSQVVDVPSGFAMNKLIPTGLAQAATPANMKRIEKMQSDIASNKEADDALFVETKAALAKETIKVTADVNDKGHAFKAVNENDIADAAKEAGVTVSPNLIVINSPIKEVGEHKVGLALGENKASFTIEVIKK